MIISILKAKGYWKRHLLKHAREFMLSCVLHLQL